MRWTSGNHLSESARAEVLRKYVHRYTREHVPQWANGGRPGGGAYPVQFDSDADWLANTRFAVCDDGSLSRRHRFCESSPTFPDNPELRGGAK